jgi:WhiB family redox-sensing transcriptional regulator
VTLDHARDAAASSAYPDSGGASRRGWPDVLIHHAPVAEVEPDTTWMDAAECAGLTDLMFSERGQDTAPAKAVCAGCAVRIECLEYALAMNERFGIWGGTSEKERRQIRANRSVVRRVKVVACGSTSGYARHARLGEPPCVSCREARARYAAAAKARMRERRTTTTTKGTA